MARRVLVTAALTTCLLMGSGVALVFATKSYRTDVLSFSATGLVEDIDSRAGGRCTVQIALYDWVNLSPGFPIGEIPAESDRYMLHGTGEVCQAVSVAMASTSGHIGFRATRASRKWHFVDRPTPALGCGGLTIDWTPRPL